MSLRITLNTFGMDREESQLEEILQKADRAVAGDVLLFPEYGAYTLKGSRKAYSVLSRTAAARKISIITSLNLPSGDLPYSDPKRNYNTLFVFSREGRVYSPQAKITPQSFEMKHIDEKYPKIDVAPFSCLNRVTLKKDGRKFSAFFFICSDLYVLRFFEFHELRSDVLLCPANFGNGAEGSAGILIDYTVKTGIFKQGFLCNSYQNAKQGLTPLTLGVEKIFNANKKTQPCRKTDMVRMVDRSCVLYPDHKYGNFQHMLKLTRKGTFTVPYSRSVKQGLRVRIGVYRKVIEL